MIDTYNLHVSLLWPCKPLVLMCCCSSQGLMLLLLHKLSQAKAAVQASYFGVPTATITKPKESIVSAAGWPSSVNPALGGLKVW